MLKSTSINDNQNFFFFFGEREGAKKEKGREVRVDSLREFYMV
jgi:hypothetical protein